jgi:hypothetical protein
MPHFYFDVVIDGVAAPDHDGVDMPSLDEARKIACATAAAMSTENGGSPKEVEIRVRAGGGPSPVATARVSLTCH